MTCISKFHLSSLISEMNKIFSKHGYNELEEKLKKTVNDNYAIMSHEEIVTRNYIPNLEYSIKNIKGEMIPFAEHTFMLSEQVQWYQASRGIPEFFEGGYFYSLIIGDSGLFQSKKIRMGLFLQNPNVDYPSHAHEAEEYYLILSGHGSW